MAHVPHLFLPGPWHGATITPSAGAVDHLERVLRSGDGHPVSYTDGRGTVGSGVWRASLVVRGSEHLVKAPSIHLTLAVAAPKAADRQRFIVEKLGELGVRGLRWLDSRFGSGHPRKPEKVRSWAISALEQSRGAHLLEVDGPTPWEALDRPLFVAHPGAASLAETPLPASPTVVVGPEGGFGPDEPPADATLVGLGPRTLRTETAAIAVASIVLAR